MIPTDLLPVKTPPAALRVKTIQPKAPTPWALPAFPRGVDVMGWGDEDGTLWLGVGSVAVWRALEGDATRFNLLDEAANVLRASGPEAASVRAFFTLAFDAERLTDPLGAAVPAGRVVVPRWLLKWSPQALRGGGAIVVWLVSAPEEGADALDASERELLRWLGRSAVPSAPPEVQCLVGPEIQTEYEQAVQRALGLIESKVLEKVVIARPCYFEASAQIPSWRLFQRVFKNNAGTLRFFLQGADGAAFLGASPECLVARDGEQVRVDVLAGTTSRGSSPAGDATQAEALRLSAKDRHEHALVRAAVLSTLAPLVASVNAPETPGLLPLTHVWHLQTPVTGTLRAGVTWGQLVRALHPTPAVGGTPRERALGAIRQLETLGRGFYAAPVGFLSADNAVAAVGLRSAHVRGNRAVAMAGAGIVEGSQPRAEWDETERKLRPMLQALSEATEPSGGPPL